jgi:hypothetical protein
MTSDAEHAAKERADATDDAAGVRTLGHRRFVGGDGDLWDRIGELQFRFLIAQGLEPGHVLLDLACGSLRGGIRFIPYLEPDRYLGFDKSIDLVILGVAEELGIKVFLEKRPRFVVNGRFDLSDFESRPDFAIAQSLFTHLTPDLVTAALRGVRSIAHEKTRFFATYFLREAGDPENPTDSHSRLVFRYTPAEFARFALETGWRATDLGGWNHPRGQRMMRFDPLPEQRG